MMKILGLVCLLWQAFLGAELYDRPANEYEVEFVRHVKKSLRNALQRESQLPPASPYLEHFLNYLISVEDITSINIGKPSSRLEGEAIVIEDNPLSYDKSLLPSYVNLFIYREKECPSEILSYFDDTFTEIFVCVFEHWSNSALRESTFKAFERLDYTILYEERIPLTGQIFVIRKPDSFFSD